MSWLETTHLVGRKVRVLECAHVDVKSGQEGEIERVVASGIWVIVTCPFAQDIHGNHMRVSTETVFAENGKFELI